MEADPNSRAIGYYPGCSMCSSASEYGKSVETVAEALDHNLVDPKPYLRKKGVVS